MFYKYKNLQLIFFWRKKPTIDLNHLNHTIFNNDNGYFFY